MLFFFRPTTSFSAASFWTTRLQEPGGLSENISFLTISPVMENGIFENTLYGSLGSSSSKKSPQTSFKALLSPRRSDKSLNKFLSISIAITFLEAESKLPVIIPVPAPISNTVSLQEIPEAHMSLFISSRSLIKFCDSSFRRRLNMAEADASNHSSLIIPEPGHFYTLWVSSTCPNLRPMDLPSFPYSKLHPAEAQPRPVLRCPPLPLFLSSPESLDHMGKRG